MVNIEQISEWFVHIVLLLVVIALFLGVGFKIKDSKLHNLRVESRDIAFTFDSISISPDNINYNYQMRDKTDFSLDQNRCMIKTKHKEDTTTPTNFFCGISKDNQIPYQVIENQIKITK